MRRRELTVLLRGDRREGSDAHEPAALRRLRATPTPPRGADVATAPALRRSTRTPPPRTPALHRLGGGRRLHRVLALTALPLLALAPVMARSASSFGMGNAIAAEIAAHPDQTDTLIAALDRGRVLAGLTTPVTRPTPPAVAAPVPARGTPADGGSPSSSDPRGTSLSPSVSPGTGAADDRTSSSAPVSTSADPSPLATVPVPTAPRPQPSPDGTPAPTTGPTTPSTPGTPGTPGTPSSAAPTSAAPTSPTSTSAPVTPTPSATHTSAPPADPQPTTAAPEPTPTTSAPPLPTTSSTPVRTGAAGSSTSQPAQVP